MSREIKFRAWHKADGKMYKVYGFSQGKWFLREKTFPMPSGAVEVMQYTGLKDRNGVEIYEGDILKITCNFELRKGVEIDKVVWWEGGAYCCSDWALFELNQNYKEGEQEFEVIGNIYENPELLETSKS